VASRRRRHVLRRSTRGRPSAHRMARGNPDDKGRREPRRRSAGRRRALLRRGDRRAPPGWPDARSHVATLARDRRRARGHRRAARGADAAVDPHATAVPRERSLPAMIVTRNPATAWRVIAGEAVVLSLDSKTLRGLNPVGSRVWELIDGRRSTDEIAARLVQEFDVDLARALQEVDVFVRQLLAKGLLTESA